MRKVVAKLMIFMLPVIPAATLFSAETPAASFEKLSINAAFVNAPEVKYNTTLPITLPRRTPANRWLMVAIDYHPQFAEKRSNSKRNVRLSAFEQNNLQYLDNVQLNVRIVLCGENPKITKNYIMLTGSTVFKTIKLDGKSHTALFFIPPQLIDRYYVPSVRPAKTRNNRMPVIGVAKAKESDFKIEAVFSVNNRELGRCYKNLEAGDLKRLRYEFQKLAETVTEERIMAETIIPKSKSPWVWYNVNHFDLESTAGTAK